MDSIKTHLYGLIAHRQHAIAKTHTAHQFECQLVIFLK